MTDNILPNPYLSFGDADPLAVATSHGAEAQSAVIALATAMPVSRIAAMDFANVLVHGMVNHGIGVIADETDDARHVRGVRACLWSLSLAVRALHVAGYNFTPKWTPEDPESPCQCGTDHEHEHEVTTAYFAESMRNAPDDALGAVLAYVDTPATGLARAMPRDRQRELYVVQTLINAATAVAVANTLPDDEDETPAQD